MKWDMFVQEFSGFEIEKLDLTTVSNELCEVLLWDFRFWHLGGATVP